MLEFPFGFCASIRATSLTRTHSTLLPGPLRTVSPGPARLGFLQPCIAQPWPLRTRQPPACRTRARRAMGHHEQQRATASDMIAHARAAAHTPRESRRTSSTSTHPSMALGLRCVSCRDVSDLATCLTASLAIGVAPLNPTTVSPRPIRLRRLALGSGFGFGSVRVRVRVSPCPFRLRRCRRLARASRRS